MHAAQGLTVDTSHAVVTSRTGPAALYVGLSRGREANTAHVVHPRRPRRRAHRHRQPGHAPRPDHRPRRRVRDRRSPSSPRSPPPPSRSRTPSRSARRANCSPTAASWPPPGAPPAGSTNSSTPGTSPPQQRATLAAEDGAATLNRVLRRAELAGHDPRQVLTDAVTSRDLAGRAAADQRDPPPHHRGRVRSTRSATGTPTGSPRVDDPAWQRYLAKLAADADARRDELGRQVAEQQPQWAIEAFGHVPDDEPAAGTRGSERAGAVAAHRELTGHDDPTTAIGARAQGRAGRGLRLLAGRLARARPTRGRPRRSRDERRPAAHARPRLRTRTDLGTAATSPTNSPAPAKPPTATAPPPPCAPPQPPPATDDRPSGHSSSRKPPTPHALARAARRTAPRNSPKPTRPAPSGTPTPPPPAPPPTAPNSNSPNAAPTRGEDAQVEQRVTADEHLDTGPSARRDHTDDAVHAATAQAEHHAAERDTDGAVVTAPLNSLTLIAT